MKSNPCFILKCVYIPYICQQGVFGLDSLINTISTFQQNVYNCQIMVGKIWVLPYQLQNSNSFAICYRFLGTKNMCVCGGEGGGGRNQIFTTSVCLHVA